MAVYTIPFALAQRNPANRSKASPASEFLTTSSADAAPAIAVSVIPPIPAAPAIILYDQMNNPAPTPPPPPSDGVITSQDYEPKFDNYDSFAADDFVIPVHQVWIIAEVDVIGESSEPPFRPIRSMFFSTRIAQCCQRRWLQAGSPTHTADSLLL